MQPHSKYRRYVLLTLGVFLYFMSYSQSWNGNNSHLLFRSWSVNMNAGITSYYGDLSLFDHNLIEKFSNESGPAYSIIVSKQFNQIFSLSGQFLSGELNGSKDFAGFNTKILEYNLHFRIDVKSIFFPKILKKLGVIGFAGVGQFLFKTKYYFFNDGLTTLELHNTGVPEFVYFFGGGLQYFLSNKVCLTTDLSLRHSQNDRLDNVNKNGDYDYYTYLSFGISYYLGNYYKQPLKNKARIAHSDRRLRQLHH